MFKNLVYFSRCVIAINGYFEWQLKTKLPHLISNPENVFEDACLYKKEIGVNHFVILTMAANNKVGKIHDRMPVFLNEKTRTMWLDPKT